MKRIPIQTLFNLQKGGEPIIIYQGKDITPLVNLMVHEYNDKYPLYALNEPKVCDRYESFRKSAILAAMDITDIEASIVS